MHIESQRADIREEDEVVVVWHDGRFGFKTFAGPRGALKAHELMDTLENDKITSALTVRGKALRLYAYNSAWKQRIIEHVVKLKVEAEKRRRLQVFEVLYAFVADPHCGKPLGGPPGMCFMPGLLYWGLGVGGVGPRAEKLLCTLNGPLIFASVPKIPFSLEEVFWFRVVGWSGPCGWVLHTPPPSCGQTPWGGRAG